MILNKQLEALPLASIIWKERALLLSR